MPTSPAADKTKMDGSVAEVGPGACPQGNTTNLSLVVVSACGGSASVCNTLGHRPTPKCRKLPLASTAASRYAIMAATEDSLCRRATACQHSFRTVPADRGKAAANDLGCFFTTLLAKELTYSFHCSSFLGLPFRILNIQLVKPKQGTTMETIGNLRYQTRDLQ